MPSTLCMLRQIAFKLKNWAGEGKTLGADGSLEISHSSRGRSLFTLTWKAVCFLNLYLIKFALQIAQYNLKLTFLFLFVMPKRGDFEDYISKIQSFEQLLPDLLTRILQFALYILFFSEQLVDKQFQSFIHSFMYLYFI